MTDLESAIFSETYNRMTRESIEKRERDRAFSTLENMTNMLREYRRNGSNCSVPLPNSRPSKEIMDRYGVNYDSQFSSIWYILEKVCKGEYVLELKKEDNA